MERTFIRRVVWMRVLEVEPVGEVVVMRRRAEERRRSVGRIRL